MQRSQQSDVIRERREASPLLQLARRIREEQGAEQTRAFLRAMVPFAAPGELKNVSEGFGIPFDPVPDTPIRPSPKPEYKPPFSDPMSLIAMLMQLKGRGPTGQSDPGVPINLIKELMRTK